MTKSDTEPTYRKKLGNALLHLRERKSLTQEKLVELGQEFGICSERQYSRIEKGHSDTTPRILNAILQTLNVSLDELAKLMYGKERIRFQNKLTEILNLFAENKNEMAVTKLEELKSKSYYDKNNPLFAQALLMCSGIIQGKVHGNFQKSLVVLCDALRITCPATFLKSTENTIDVDFLANHVFSINEYQILASICVIKSQINQVRESISMLTAMRTSLSNSNVEPEIRHTLIPNTYFNLATIKLVEATSILDYETVLFFCKEGIEFCQNERIYTILGHLYCVGGDAYYFLDKQQESLDYFRKSIEILSLHGNTETAILIKQRIADKYAIYIEIKA